MLKAMRINWKFIGSRNLRGLGATHTRGQVLNFDEFVKSRHPGESRGPVVCNYPIFLDTGFRRYDVKGGFSTFYENITVHRLLFTEFARCGNGHNYYFFFTGKH